MSVIGIADFRAAMSSLPTTLKRTVLRDALRKAAIPVQASTRLAAPVLDKARLSKVHNRLPGTMRNAIVIRDSRRAKLQGNVGVFVNVRPLPGNKYKRTTIEVPNFKGGVRKRSVYKLIKKTKRNSGNPLDPFYWRFVQFGTKKMTKRDFLGAGVARFPDALKVFEHELAAGLAAIQRKGGAIV